MNADEPGGVVSFHGFVAVPSPVTFGAFVDPAVFVDDFEPVDAAAFDDDFEPFVDAAALVDDFEPFVDAAALVDDFEPFVAVALLEPVGFFAFVGLAFAAGLFDALRAFAIDGELTRARRPPSAACR